MPGSNKQVWYKVHVYNLVDSEPSKDTWTMLAQDMAEPAVDALGAELACIVGGDACGGDLLLGGGGGGTERVLDPYMHDPSPGMLTHSWQVSHYRGTNARGKLVPCADKILQAGITQQVN